MSVSLEITPFVVYTEYLALKRHFSDKTYDYHKYNGKLNVKFSSYENRRDKYHFEKLSKKENYKDILFAALSHNSEMWIGDIANDDKLYREWKGVMKSLEYTFCEDVKRLDLDDFNSNLIVKDGEFPPLLKMFQQNKIHRETLIILNFILNFTPHWNKAIDDNVVWPSIFFQLKKYSSFFTIDRYKYKELLKKQLENRY